VIVALAAEDYVPAVAGYDVVVASQAVDRVRAIGARQMIASLGAEDRLARAGRDHQGELRARARAGGIGGADGDKQRSRVDGNPGKGAHGRIEGQPVGKSVAVGERRGVAERIAGIHVMERVCGKAQLERLPLGHGDIAQRASDRRRIVAAEYRNAQLRVRGRGPVARAVAEYVGDGASRRQGLR
jgi:hypothetical protein